MILAMGLVVFMVLGFYALLALWGCFEEENSNGRRKEDEGK